MRFEERCWAKIHFRPDGKSVQVPITNQKYSSWLLPRACDSSLGYHGCLREPSFPAGPRLTSHLPHDALMAQGNPGQNLPRAVAKVTDRPPYLWASTSPNSFQEENSPGDRAHQRRLTKAKLVKRLRSGPLLPNAAAGPRARPREGWLFLEGSLPLHGQTDSGGPTDSGVSPPSPPLCPSGSRVPKLFPQLHFALVFKVRWATWRGFP